MALNLDQCQDIPAICNNGLACCILATWDLGSRMQAADDSNGLFNLAISVTRPTEQDSAQRAALQHGAAAAVTWHEGRIDPAMVNEVGCCAPLLLP